MSLNLLKIAFFCACFFPLAQNLQNGDYLIKISKQYKNYKNG